MTNSTSTPTVGETVFVYQPSTEVKAGWHKTTVVRAWEEDGETVFETEFYVRDSNNDWNEWSKSDKGKCWDWSPGPVSADQDKLFWSVFD